MLSRIYVKHLNKFYDVETEMFAGDYVKWIFKAEEEHTEFFESFHTRGDVNYINGEYFLRHQDESYSYEILFRYDSYDSVLNGCYILEVMGIDYDWVGSEESKKELRAHVSFLNGDKRTESMFTERFREIKIDKLLSDK